MKITRLRTAWIVFILVLHTGVTNLRIIVKNLFGKPERPWVDKVLSGWANQLLKKIGVNCIVINPNKVEPEAGKATIIMCNHSSLYDIPISYKAFPKHSIRMLSKKELSQIPLLGRAMRAAEFPFIDRKNRRQAMEDLSFAKKLMESGIVLWVAPEGTRSKDGRLAPLKKGAFITAIESEATIIPIGIRGAFDILPARSYRFNLNQTAEIHIGTPIDTKNFTTDSKNELVAEVYQQLKQLTGETEAQ